MVTRTSPTGYRLAIGALILLFMNVTVAPSARADPANAFAGAVDYCKNLVPGFDEQAKDIVTQMQPGNRDQAVGVRLSWTPGDPVLKPGDAWIECWFLPLNQTNGQWQVDQVKSKRWGIMQRYDVQQFFKVLWLRTHDNAAKGPRPKPSAASYLLYLLQQVINGVTLGCLYSLLAVAFNLIFGIARFINLAFGELYMIGAFATYIAYALTLHLGGAFTLLPIVATGAYVVATGAIAGWTVNRLVFQRLARSATTVPLVASIGLAILISDGVLLLQGPKTRWMPQYQQSAWRIIDGLGYDVYLRKGHVIVGLATLAIAGILWWINKRTDFGRTYRACAQDPRMAALLGVDVRGTIAFSFALSGALTGAAGLFEALQYNAVDFHMGFIVGIKSLIAAVLGGIGSIRGAMLGGILLAVIETYAGVAIGFEWRDIVVFGVLAAVLLFRPAGLFGTLRLVPADERP
jgi:branched-chain amino acid transport system permease protein